MSEDTQEKKNESPTSFDEESLQRLLNEAAKKGKLEAETSGTVQPPSSKHIDEKEHFLTQSFGFIALGKYKEAIECFDKVLGVDPNNVKALTYKGTALRQLKKDNEAMKFYNKALEIDPNDKEALEANMQILKFNGRYKEMLACCDNALQNDQNNMTVLNYKGDALNGLGRFKEAFEFSEKMLEINPTNVDALHNKTRALGGLGRIHEAVECIKKILEIAPNDPRTKMLKEMLRPDGMMSSMASNFGANSEEMIYMMYDKFMNPTAFNPKKLLGGFLSKLGNLEYSSE